MVWLTLSRRQMFVPAKLVLIPLVLCAFLPSCIGSGDGAGAVGTITPVRGVLSTLVPRAAGAQPIPLQPTAALDVAVPTAVPTPTPVVAAATLPAAAAPTPLPAASTARFSNLRFAPAAGGPAQSEFPAGTEIVFPIWDYEGLSAADSMRRIWFRDDQIWITRDEEWDWEAYGSQGTMRDISVFDNEGDGLHPATYRLQLYLNDEFQIEGLFIVLAE